MNQTSQEAPAGKGRKSSRDRWVKLAFPVIILAVAAAVYFHQLRGPGLAGDWSRDLEATLASARQENRPVLVLFRAERANDDTKQIIGKSLNHSIVRKAVEKWRYLCAVVVDDTMESGPAKKYGVESLPTVVTLSPDGSVVGRRRGYVGPAEVEIMLKKARENEK